MAHRYQAPEHVTAVFSASGEHRADKHGVIELPAGAPDSDHDAMRRAGCIPAAAKAAAPVKAKSSPKKGGGKKTPAVAPADQPSAE